MHRKCCSRRPTRRFSLQQTLAILLIVGGFNIAWLVALLAGWAIPLVLGKWFRARIDGVTGDLLGACSEIVEIVVLAMGCIA